MVLCRSAGLRPAATSDQPLVIMLLHAVWLAKPLRVTEPRPGKGHRADQARGRWLGFTERGSATRSSLAASKGWRYADAFGDIVLLRLTDPRPGRNPFAPAHPARTDASERRWLSPQLANGPGSVSLSA